MTHVIRGMFLFISQIYFFSSVDNRYKHMRYEECGWCYYGGQCDEEEGYYVCQCQDGFYGSHCQGTLEIQCINVYLYIPSMPTFSVLFTNGLNTVRWFCLHITSNRSKVLLTKTVMLTVV